MADLTRSAITQARRITLAQLANVAVTRRTACSRATGTAGQAKQLSARLTSAAKSTRDGVTVVNGESARLLFALNDADDADIPQLRRSIASQLDAVLDGELSTAATAEVGQLGRDRLASLTQAAVSAWQQRQRANLRHGLNRLDRRLAGDLAAQLDMLRDSAAELLGLDLALPEPDGKLAPIRWPAGPAAGAVGPSGPMLPRSHHTMPGERSRRRARQHLHDQIADLVSSQIDAARSELRKELAEATRTLALAAERRCADATDEIQAARRAADDIFQSALAEARHREDQLAGRERALRHMLGLLDHAAADST